VFHTTIDLYIVQGHQNNKTRDTHYKRHNIYNFEQHWKLKIELLLTSMKTRGEIRCPIANTRVKHSKKAKQNMHMTVNFWGFFFGQEKYFSAWQDLHVCQSEWLTTSQQVSVSLDQLWTSAHLRLAYVGIQLYLGIFKIVFDVARRHLVSYRNLCNLLITHPPAPFNSISGYFANYIFLFVMIYVYCLY
jgi:hypothetical protein